MNNQQNEEDLPEQTGEPESEGEGEGVLEFVTPLVSIEKQVGTHVIAALQHPETVAVVSTVAARQDGTQCIVSVGLDPEMLDQVQQLLMQAKQEKKQRTPCIGFHCFIDDPEEDDEAAEQSQTNDEGDPNEH